MKVLTQILVFGAITSLPQAVLVAQQVVSPELSENQTLTFRLPAPAATAVSVNLSRGVGSIDMTKNEDGIWIGVTEPLEAGIYEYSFRVDGTRQIDPHNRWIKKWFSLDSLVEVPGNPALLTERTSVPHGTLHRIFYGSTPTTNDRTALVYTPPGYEDSPERTYPVVYLLHGFGDDETAWTDIGRANFIVDNLISQEKLSPMIIVMPNGHPIPVDARTRFQDYGQRNERAMEEDVMNWLMPKIEKNYRTSNTPQNRAIVGLSMGGGHSLHIGLKYSNTFAHIGAFSAATPAGDLALTYPDLLANGTDQPSNINQQAETIWIACGKDDFLFNRNREFIKSLRDLDVKFEFQETDGAHNWDVWREYLPTFLQLLFKSE